MSIDEIKNFEKCFGNDKRVRTVLNEKIPVLEKLESLDSLKDFKITAFREYPGEMISVYCEGIATNNLYPHVRKNLIKAGVVKKYNVRSSGVNDSNTEKESESLRLLFYGARLNVYLKAYNPDYKSKK